MDIAFATATKMPKPDRDTRLVIEALAQLHIEAEIHPWDSNLGWKHIPLVVIRSTWDYSTRRDEFLAWAQHVGASTRLVNPASLVQWNIHKRYLLEVASAGVPVVPTALVEGSGSDDSSTLLSDLSWDELVIKPAVGVGATDALKCLRTELRAAAHLTRLRQQGSVLVQPFVSDVTDFGEVSLVFFGGKLSHAIRKRPKANDFRVQDHHGGTLHAHTPSAEESAVAAAALAATPIEPTYGRIDLVRWRGCPVVMEIEVIEPELFLPHAPQAAQRLARVLQQRLER